MHTRRLSGPLLLLIAGALSWACKDSDDDDGAGGTSGNELTLSLTDAVACAAFSVEVSL